MNGKQKKCYKGSQGDEGSLLKVSSWGPCVKTTHIPPVCQLPSWATRDMCHPGYLIKGSQAGTHSGLADQGCLGTGGITDCFTFIY